MGLSQRDINRIADEVHARIEGGRGGRDLLPLQQYAKRVSLSARQIRRRLQKKSLPLRDAEGRPKKEGDRSTSYVYVPELERGEQAHPRSVANALHS